MEETLPPPAQTAQESAPEATLDAAAVRGVVEEGEHRVQACYQAWLDALVELDQIDSTPVLSGRLLASFLIVSDGSVEEPTIQESDFDDDYFEGCVLSELARWRFPSPAQADAPVLVELPLFFEPRRE